VPELRLRSVESNEELHVANDLMAKVHFLDAYEGLRWLEESGAGYPGFRREHTRIALMADEIVGALRFTTDTIRIGEARLKMGGLGCVTTAGNHRHAGVARQLISDALRGMRDEKYHVSMLFGIPNFYHRFGFATTLAEYSAIVPLYELSSLDLPALKNREGKPGDIPAFQKMHALHDGQTACSLLRSAAHITNLWHRWKNVQALMDDQGKVLAYFLSERKESDLHILETGLTERALCPQILQACAQEAVKESCARLVFRGPPAHPMNEHLHRFHSIHEMRLDRNAGGMMAFADLIEALESMAPEWERCLERSHLREQHVEVTLLVDRQPYRVRAHHGAIDVAAGTGENKLSLSAAELIQLVTGYRHLNEVLDKELRILTQEARELLAVLLPKRTPYVWENDRF
jgi:predicted acetyltransferase